jgi:hypothetical protein
MYINDGKGKGVQASVSREQRLRTEALTHSPQMHMSFVYQKAFQIVSGVQNIATAGAYGLLAVRNEGEEDIAITYIRIGVDKVETAQCLCEVLLNGDWADTGSDAGIYNMNGGSSLLPDITARYNNVPTGTPFTIDSRWVRGPDEVIYSKEGSIILPTGAHIALRVTTETDAVNVHGRISMFVFPREVKEQ